MAKVTKSMLIGELLGFRIIIAERSGNISINQ